MSDSKVCRLLGLFSAIGTFAIVCFTAHRLGGFNILYREFIVFASGNAFTLKGPPPALPVMLAAILATVAIELPISLISLPLTNMMIGSVRGRHALSEVAATMDRQSVFFNFFILVLIEELIARWFFLGLLTKWSPLSGQVALYALILIGNSLWAAIHISNYRDERDWNILRVMPQFIAGLFYSYLFIRYGLLAAVLAHYASNAILFAMHKVERFQFVNLLIIIYAALIAAGSYHLIDKPLSDTLVWFSGEAHFVINGWVFADYVKVSIFFSALATLFVQMLCYDQGGGEKKLNLVELICYAPLGVLIIAFIYWIAGFAFSDVAYRVLIAAILVSFLSSGESGSASSRVFWVSLPITYVTVSILNALGIVASIGWILISVIVFLPATLLRRHIEPV